MISVDLDSTLNDLMYAWVEFIIEKGGRCSLKDITSFDDPILLDNVDFFDDVDIYDKLLPLTGAKEFLENLKKIQCVQIVTDSFEMTTEEMQAKDDFVLLHFGDIPVIHVQGCKLEAARGSILVDDKLENIEKHRSAGDIGFLFTNGEYLYSKDEPSGTYAGILGGINDIHSSKNC